MSIFKKSEGVDVLDFTRLQKKGILKVPEKKVEQNVKVNSQGYVDLGLSSLPRADSAPENVQSYSNSLSSESSGASALGFLDSLASSASSSSGNSNEGDSVELQGLKNKIEDLEYKLDRLMEKVAKIESSRS